MQKFSFLSGLQNTNTTEKPSLDKSIDYSEYSVTLHNKKSKIIHIPIREVEEFESELIDMVLITEGSLKTLARKFNGILEK